MKDDGEGGVEDGDDPTVKSLISMKLDQLIEIKRKGRFSSKHCCEFFSASFSFCCVLTLTNMSSIDIQCPLRHPNNAVHDPELCCLPCPGSAGVTFYIQMS